MRDNEIEVIEGLSTLTKLTYVSIDVWMVNDMMVDVVCRFTVDLHVSP